MTSPAYSVANYIAGTLSKGILGTSVFVNDMPNAPTNCIAVYQYGGDPSNKGFGDDYPLQNYAIQVAVRNSNAETAESNAYDIHDEFDKACSPTISGYTWFDPMQPPFLLERQKELQAVIYAFNMEVQRNKP